MESIQFKLHVARRARCALLLGLYQEAIPCPMVQGKQEILIPPCLYNILYPTCITPSRLLTIYFSNRSTTLFCPPPSPPASPSRPSSNSSASHTRASPSTGGVIPWLAWVAKTSPALSRRYLRDNSSDLRLAITTERFCFAPRGRRGGDNALLRR